MKNAPKKTAKHPAQKRLDKLQKQQEARKLGMRIKASRITAGYKKIIEFKNKFFPEVTKPLYYQWETGIRHPSEKAVEKIAKICKVNPKWLKTSEGEPLRGIKLPKKELTLKKAYIAYHMIEEQFAQGKKMKTAHEKLCKQMYEFTTIPIEKAGTKKQIIVAINTKLMQTILEELINLYKSTKKPIDASEIAKYATQIYSSIIEHETREKEQLRQAKIVVASYKQLIG